MKKVMSRTIVSTLSGKDIGMKKMKVECYHCYIYQRWFSQYL